MTPCTARELTQTLAHQLDQKYHDRELSIHYAWWMVEAITAQSKSDLLLQRTLHLSSAQHQQLTHWVHQQVHDHIPLPYLLGSVPFGNCTIQVEPPILIPRPETEAWCMELIAKLQKFPHQQLRIVDIGTGSGCIAIALAQALPQATIYAIDISSKALTVARKNAALNNIENIQFIQSDLFEQLPSHTYFDLIVANPPYIALEEWQTLDLSVRNWEDTNALIAPDNGMELVKKIIQRAPHYLQPHPALQQHHIPHLTIEIGYQQGTATAAYFRDAHFHDIRIEKDISGNDRIVTGYVHNEVATLT